MPILSRVGTGLFLKSAGGGGTAEPGEAVFHADKTTQTSTWDASTYYTWTVPAGVTEISVVCIGGGGSGVAQHDGASGCGGGLAYKNNITVVPGSTIDVTVGGGAKSAGWGNWGKKGDPSMINIDGTVYAKAGGGNAQLGSYGNGGIDNSNDGIPSGDFDGGGNGGRGTQWGGCRQAGGGCGGYSEAPASYPSDAAGGDSGNPQYSGAQAGAGNLGGGGGGQSANGSTNYYSSGGGGTGIYGRGANGASGQGSSSFNETQATGKGGSEDPWTNETNGLSVPSYTNTTGLRGYSSNSSWNLFAWSNSSNEIDPSTPNGYRRNIDTQSQGQTRPDGGFPGGGGGGGHSGSPCGYGGHGCVRIVWGKINSMKREFPNQGVNMTDKYPGLSANTPTTYGRQMMY